MKSIEIETGVNIIPAFHLFAPARIAEPLSTLRGRVAEHSSLLTAIKYVEQLVPSGQRQGMI